MFIAIVGTTWAYFIHTLNINYLSDFNEAKIRHGMIITSDDASYLAPAENFIKTGVWKDNSVGKSAYVQRPPGMAMLHLIACFIYPGNPMMIHKWMHLMIHALGLIFFGLVARSLFTKKWALVVFLIYALLPCFWGYTFYNLTESVTPTLMIILCWSYIRFQHMQNSNWLLIQGLLAGILLLVRPQLMIFILPMFYNLWLYIRARRKESVAVVILTLFISFGGFTLWQIRAVTIFKEWPGIHPIYHSSNQSQYRPVHHSFGQLYKIWEHNSQRFHSHMELIWGDANQDTSTINQNISIVLAEIPGNIINQIGHDEFRNIFKEYHLVGADVRQGNYQTETIAETGLRNHLDDLTVELRNKNWAQNYFITPTNSAAFLLSKSQLNLYIFQHKFRGQWWMESIRYFCVGLILLITALSISLLLNWKNKSYFLWAITLISYLMYLFFVQRMNEERYLVPLLPVFLLLGLQRLHFFFRKLKP